jgi:hypothetical protein
MQQHNSMGLMTLDKSKANVRQMHNLRGVAVHRHGRLQRVLPSGNTTELQHVCESTCNTLAGYIVPQPVGCEPLCTGYCMQARKSLHGCGYCMHASSADRLN